MNSHSPTLAFRDSGPARTPISPMREMGAYEALWLQTGATFKTVADRFSKDPAALPSDFVSQDEAERAALEVLTRFRAARVGRFGVRIHHAGDYPVKLRDARHPVELLYYRGEWELSETRSVAIVGSRQATPDGLQRAARMSRDLVKAGFTVASGLAAGVDRAAHLSALEHGGKTIAVIGTPLDSAYPKENRELQEQIAREFLLISQVPVLRYAKQAPPQNRLFFPERNVTMSALTEATIIIEASDTSGTLTQARAAMHQGRKLFILNSCFERTGLTWPARFEAQGAIRVRGMDDVWSVLCPSSSSASV